MFPGAIHDQASSTSGSSDDESASAEGIEENTTLIHQENIFDFLVTNKPSTTSSSVGCGVVVGGHPATAPSFLADDMETLKPPQLHLNFAGLFSSSHPYEISPIGANAAHAPFN
eukprot:GEZU01042212.1.p2 GENE.GEZU01042212.1~~GEZU01042212.1.p2  ORF type:complete len:114 (+),score=31.38 GEZU01042212.1:630-971(+)